MAIVLSAYGDQKQVEDEKAHNQLNLHLGSVKEEKLANPKFSKFHKRRKKLA